MVVARVAVHYVEILNFVEVVLRSIGRIDAGNARVEAATEDGRQAGLLKALLVGPLPAVFEVRLVDGLIVGRIQVVDAAGKARLHNGQVLVGQGQVHNDVGPELLEQGRQLLDAVGVDLRGLYGRIADGLHDGVTLRLGTAGNHDVREHVSVLRHFVCGNRGYASRTDD